MSVGARNPAIDVLRGVSIVLVLLHHFWIAYLVRDVGRLGGLAGTFLHAVFRNGNYAVTMFFVISGFLITSNAERRWGSLGSVAPLAFYRFRAARIFPCLLLLLAIVDGLAALNIGIFRDHPEFGGPAPLWLVNLASVTFWMNVLMQHAGWVNYPLCVQWSLAIEEVFYLTFPLLCLVLRRERLLMAAWSVFIVLGPVWRATHQASEYDELNAYLACFDGIAFGCCAAIIARRVRLPAQARLPTLVLVATGMAGFYLSASIGRTGVYGVTLMAFETAILLVVLAQAPRAPATYRILAPLRRAGRLSYELYLFHLVVLGGLRAIWQPADSGIDTKVLLLAAYLVLAFIVAAAVSRFYSEPLNRRLRSDASGAPSFAET